MEADWVAVYKGLRMPMLALALLIIIWYIYRPSQKQKIEDPKFRMLEDIDSEVKK